MAQNRDKAIKMQEYKALWGKEEIKNLDLVAACTALSMFSGNFVSSLEERLAALFPGYYALAANSGTAALHLALECIGIRPGDEVIVPAVSYAATALAPLYVGAKPVFADVIDGCFTLDPKSCERILSSRTRAIIFVNLFGTTGNISEIVDLCKRYDLKLVQDCAQSFGTQLSGRLVGGECDVACFSFFETKTISTGEGGAVLFCNKDSLEKGRRLRHHGMDVSTGCRAVRLVGYNFKMSELQAAVTLAQLSKIGHLAQLRRDFARVVRSALESVVLLQQAPINEITCWDKVCFLLKDIVERNGAESLGKSLGVRRYLSRPLCDEPVFEGYVRDPHLDSTRDFCDRHLVIQSSPVFDKHSLEMLSLDFARQLADMRCKVRL